MGRAIGAVVWVLAAGVLGTLLGEIGCFLAVAAVMSTTSAINAAGAKMASSIAARGKRFSVF